MALRSLISSRPPPLWRALLIGVVLIFAAWLGRQALTPFVGPHGLPYATFLLAAAAATVWAGRLSGALVILVGGLAAHMLFAGPGEQFDIRAAGAWGLVIFVVVTAIICLVADTMVQALRRERAAAERLAVISREAQHRVKNLLAMTEAMVRQTGRQAASVEDFQSRLLDRIRSLARAQDLLLAEPDGRLPLRRLAESSLEPFDLASRLAAPLPPDGVSVPSDLAVPLALVLNELGANATKYGALSTDDGRVEITWRTEGDELHIDWRELDGPPVAQPSARGFGSRLFETALPAERGKVRLSYEPLGLACAIRLDLADPANP